MEQTEKLKISSPDDLYVVLKNNQALTYQDATLASFFDFMELTKVGCKCKAKTHFEEAYRIYYGIKDNVSQRVIDLLKANYNVKTFSFFDRENHLFDL